MALNTTTNPTSSQTATQNPQSAGSSNMGASQSSGGVQPGTSESLLNSQNGIHLTNRSLPGVSLNNFSTRSTAPGSSQAAPPATHHINAPLLGFAILLIVAAAVLFWSAGRSAKNTT